MTAEEAVQRLKEESHRTPKEWESPERRNIRKEPVDPLTWPHASINRRLNNWYCNHCGAEFVPKNPKHQTSWDH